MTTGLGVAALRNAAVLVPVLFTVALWPANPAVRVRAGAGLALLWNTVGLLGVNAAAVRAGWWTFGTAGAMWAQVPVDVVLGWALLWGAVPVLLAEWVRPVWTVAALIAGDVFAMGSLAPLVTLHHGWWWGEVLAVAGCLLPGVLLGWATASQRLLAVRVALQVTLFAALLLVLLPAVAFSRAGVDWAQPAHRVGGPVDLLLIQLGAVVAVVGLRAVAEFAAAGGTPFPWDPPQQLVTGGPYAYVANPMQLCATLLLALAAVVLDAPVLGLAAVIAVIFSGGIAGWYERRQLRQRHGGDWSAYRRRVHDWLPRAHPYPGRPPARLYVAASCDPCRGVGAWFERRRLTALTIVAAETHPGELRRIRYEADGLALDGTRAIGAALEHISLGYAVLGWLLRAPGLAWFLQLLADAVGVGPREPAPPR